MLRHLLLTCMLAALATTLHAQTPLVNAKKRTATITIDGNPNESIWDFTNNNVTKNIIGTNNNTVKFAVLWDSLNLYVAFTVLDANKFNESTNAWDDDAVEIYIDAENNGGTAYGVNDRQFVKEWNASTIWEKSNKTTGVQHAWANITGGYAVEILIPWSNIGITNPALGTIIGFDVACDDDDNGGARESQCMWAGDGNNWQWPQNFGDLKLVASDTQAPTAPTNLTASAITQTTLTLNWTASTDNVGVTGYDVFRNGTKINSSLVTTTTYNVTGLTAATAYQFYIQAKDAAGNTSANSVVLNVTTPDTQAPTAPANLAASAVTQTTLTLNWTASTDNVGVTGYDVYRNGIKINASLVTVTTYNVTGLTASTAYQFYVQAKDAAGNISANSNTINVTTPDTQAPTAPTNLAASAVTASTLTLNWTASTDNVGVAGYDVFRNGIKINASLVAATTYNVTGLINATAYQFYVQAKDAAGNTSANSNTINVTTPDTQAPTAPSNLSASAITQTTLTVNWTASTDNVAVTGYDIYQDNVKINSSPVVTTSYNVTGLTTNTSYDFYITASDAAGNTSSNSSILTVATLLPPDTESPTAPANLAASTVTSSSLTLNWDASADNVGVTGYDIYQDNIKINASTVTATTYNVTGLIALNSYDFYVVAKDAAGNISGNSNTVNVLTPDTQAPTAPGNLSASSVTQTTLTLNWTASTDNVAVTGYDVYQDNVKINSTPVTTTSFDVTGLTNSTSYAFYIQASDAAGNTSNSSTLNVTTLAPPDVDPPTAPVNLAASLVTQTTLTLNWTASTDNVAVTGYDVYQDNIKINASTIAGTSFNVTGLAAVTSYNFYVVAKDAAGNISANSNAINITTPDTQAPTAPTNLASSNITATSATLNWTASTDNIGVAGYDVYRNGTKINASIVTGTTYNVTGLTQVTAYSFFVKALDATGNASANSNTINVTTPDGQAPTAPTNLASSNLASTSLTLNWAASTDNVAVTGYDVYQNGTKINASVVAATTYNVTGLTASTAYSFFVQARDAAGNISANSNTVNVTTPAVASCTGTGAINFQKFLNITGTTVASLTSNAAYPNSPSSTGTLTSFEIPTNTADNYGMRVYGYICPPATGSYTFWIASDDASELWLSTTSSAANKVKIASNATWTNSREWNKFATQKSSAITLTAGQLYYVEALMKEGTQGDNMAVGWAKPGEATTAPSEVIPGSQLIASIPDVQAPSAPTNLSSSNIGTVSLTLNWTASTDNVAVTGYDVYRNGVKYSPSLITSTTYNVTGLLPLHTYSFTVIARDAAGNSSAASNAVNVTTLDITPGTETFTQRTVIANQRMPHDLVYGPDGNIWYTERFAGTVSFVTPATGVKRVVLTLGTNMVRVSGQDGLMGLALHPQFRQGKPYVYISYTYQSTSATVRKTRIARYTYDSVARTLGSPVTILENIPGSNDHNSARLAIGPDLKLYYTVGDMGAGQFDNQNRTQNAQNLNVYEGKVLRLNTEAIAGSWIPTDNPFSNAGVKTAVYTYGHRNPQGLVWGKVNGVDILYSSEHGPYSDDELNIIEVGRNYGWPRVVGFCDGNYNGRFVGNNLVGNEQNNCVTLNVREPIKSLFPATNPPDSTTDNMTWPSTAPSGTDFYGSTAIPGWQNSLLVAELKKGAVARFKLSNDGMSIISDTINYFVGKGRFRDVVVSPDGLKIYVACDSSGSTSGPTGNVTTTPANPGSILEFTYVPIVGSRMMNELITQSKVIDDVKDKSLDVYPNPASSFFIVYNYGEAGRSIELVDMNGKTVKRQAVINLTTKVDVSDLATGLYVLKISNSAGKVIRTEKMIIQR